MRNRRNTIAIGYNTAERKNRRRSEGCTNSVALRTPVSEKPADVAMVSCSEKVHRSGIFHPSSHPRTMRWFHGDRSRVVRMYSAITRRPPGRNTRWNSR